MSPFRHGKKIKWGIIADDLTGASDTGALFAGKGFSTTVVLDRTQKPSRTTEVIVVTTDSRNDRAAEARNKVREACRFFKASNIRLLYKKIDSTMKGNIRAEMDEVMKWQKLFQAVICPAFPDQGRIVRKGVLHVHGQSTVNLAACLRCRGIQAHLSVAAPISISKVGKALGQSRRFVLADAETDRDLARLVDGVWPRLSGLLLSGSAGLARHVADVLRKNSKRIPFSGSKCARSRRSQLTGAPLIFTGSGHSITEQQIETLIRDRKAFVHSFREWNHGDIQIRLDKGQPVVMRLPVHRQADELIAQLLRAVDGLIESASLTEIVIVGGDTGSLVMRWLGALAIELQGEIAPGIPWGILIGGKADGTTLCTKAGGFGETTSLIRVVDFLRNRRRGRR